MCAGVFPTFELYTTITSRAQRRRLPLSGEPLLLPLLSDEVCRPFFPFDDIIKYLSSSTSAALRVEAAGPKGRGKGKGRGQEKREPFAVGARQSQITNIL